MLSKTWFIGNHATHFNQKGNLKCAEALYHLNSDMDSIYGKLYVSGYELGQDIPYTVDAMREVFENHWQTQDDLLLIGDISERLMEAAIAAGTNLSNLRGVFVLYPVGMVALDMRKEMAKIILTLKKCGIPTYLIRDEAQFFASIEPTSHSLVPVHARIDNSLGLEYLCGLSDVAIGNM